MLGIRKGRFTAFDCLEVVLNEMVLEGLFFDAEVVLGLLDSGGELGFSLWREWGLVANGGDEDVFGGVLGAHELEQVGGVALLLEGLGAEGVGDHFRHALGVGSEPEHGVERVGGGGHVKLFADLLVAAGGGDDEFGSGFDGFGQGIIRGGIAGMQGDDEVGAGAVGVRNGALDEAKAGKAVLSGDVVAELDHVGAVLDARYRRLQAHGGGEVVVEGEGEVAFAGAHVGDFPLLAVGLAEEAVEDLDVFVDLAEFILRGFEDFAFVVGEAEGVEPGFVVGADEAVLGAVVGEGGGVFINCGLGEGGEVLAFHVEDVVCLDGVEAGGDEGGTEELGEDGEGFVRGVILHNIPRFVVIGEAELEDALDGDGADVDGFEVVGCMGGLGEGDARKGAGLDCGGDEGKPVGERGGVLHGRVMGPRAGNGKGARGLRYGSLVGVDGFDDAASDAVSGGTGGLGFVIIRLGVEHEGGAVGIHDTGGFVVIQRDAAVDDRGDQCAIGGDLLIGHVSGMGAPGGLMAVGFAGGIEVVSGRGEFGSFACAGLVNVEGEALACGEVAGVEGDFDTCSGLGEGGDADFLVFGIHQLGGGLRGDLGGRCLRDGGLADADNNCRHGQARDGGYGDGWSLLCCWCHDESPPLVEELMAGRGGMFRL